MDRIIPRRIAALALLALPLAGCVEDMSASGGGSVGGNPAEQACLRDVARTTGNSQVTVLGSEFSQAGTGVRVGVGPQRAPWQCIAYSDGTTAGIQSLTDEGSL